MKRLCILLGAPVLVNALPSQAVTCSCAGVPLLSSMESATPEAGSWFVSGAYQYRDLGDAYSGTDEVDDGIRRDRTSQTMIAEVSRGFTKAWSASILFSYVEHEREVGGGDRQKVDDWGDSIAMVKYSPIRQRVYSRHGLTLGLGARIPMGEDDARSSRGFRLAEDMQPSTGAWGTIGWVNYAYAFNQAGTIQAYGTASYTYNQDNDRDYQFGHEATAELGGTWNLSDRWAVIGGLRYRNAERDERNGVEVPNTGGEWLDFVPAVQYHFTPELAAKVGGTIPVWRDLNDALQFTTSYAFNMSMSYVF